MALLAFCDTGSSKELRTVESGVFGLEVVSQVRGKSDNRSVPASIKLDTGKVITTPQRKDAGDCLKVLLGHFFASDV
jgi:hypothetical protein